MGHGHRRSQEHPISDERRGRQAANVEENSLDDGRSRGQMQLRINGLISQVPEEPAVGTPVI